MSINMADVKQIMYGNKEVTKIEDGLGNVLWQKASRPEWHTLWSGSAYARLYTYNERWQSTISDTSVLATIPSEAMASGCQLRITWSYSWGTKPDSSGRYYIKNSRSSNSVPEQPCIFDTAKLNPIVIGLLANGASDSRYHGQAYLKWDSDTKALSLATFHLTQQRIGRDYFAQFTVTKIEIYY